MKVQKIAKPSTFQPVELKITIESKEELYHLSKLSSLSSDVHFVLRNVCLNPETNETLKSLLDGIGKSL